eukprot:9476684-Pyramimonas_sp.AAC.1
MSDWPMGVAPSPIGEGGKGGGCLPGGGFPRERLWPEAVSRCSTRRCPCPPPGLVPKLRAPSWPSKELFLLPTSNPWSAAPPPSGALRLAESSPPACGRPDAVQGRAAVRVSESQSALLRDNHTLSVTRC